MVSIMSQHVLLALLLLFRSMRCFPFLSDDTELYVPLKPRDPSSNLPLILSLMSWMSQNHLKFDDDKSEVILFGPPNSIIFDASFCFDVQVRWLCNILPFSRSFFLAIADLQKYAHAHRLDYCNTLLSYQPELPPLSTIGTKCCFLTWDKEA